MAKYCINCGKELEEGAKVCSECKQPVEEEVVEKKVEAKEAKEEKVEKVEIVNNVTSTPAPKKGNGMAVAGFVISLVSFILCCGSFSWLSLIFSIIGIVSAKNVDGKGKGMAIAGLIISIIGMLLLIGFFILLPILGAAAEESNNSYHNDPWNNSSYHYGY